MSQRLSATLIILFAVAQLPFAYLGLSALAGFAQDGPGYFYLLYLATSDAESLDDSEGFLGPRQARTDPFPEGTAGALPSRPRPEVSDRIIVRPPSEERTPIPRRHIRDLPAYRTESGLKQRLSALQGLPVDYVSIPPKARDSADDEAPLVVTLRPSSERRVLLLAGRPGLSWKFAGPIPKTLTGVLLVAADPHPEDLVIGLPHSLPVARIDLSRHDFPFVVGAIPVCKSREARPQSFSCARIRTADDGSFYTDFQIADQAVRGLLRGEIESLSAAFADRADRWVPVPEEIVDQAARDRAQSVLERHAGAKELEQVDRDNSERFDQRLNKERRLAVIREEASHRSFRRDDILARQPRLLVVSAYRAEGAPRELPAAALKDYAAYREARVGTIAVEIDVSGPVVVVLSAFEPVDWRVHVKGESQVLAVHVEGLGAPTVTGVPQSIPLRIRSRAFGDSETASYLSLPRNGDRSEHPRTLRDLKRLKSFYGGAPVALHSRRSLGTARLTDSTDFVALTP